MTDVKPSPMTRAIVRQQALRQMCYGANGELTKNARLIAARLNRFCNGDGRDELAASPVTGAIDPLAMARAAGRREVFDLLARMLSLKLEDRHNLKEEI